MQGIQDDVVELLPCPFCGGAPYQNQIGNEHTNERGFDTGCKKCRVKISDRVRHRSLEWCRQQSSAAWNTRAAINARPVDIEAGAGALWRRQQIIDGYDNARGLEILPENTRNEYWELAQACAEAWGLTPDASPRKDEVDASTSPPASGTNPPEAA